MRRVLGWVSSVYRPGRVDWVMLDGGWSSAGDSAKGGQHVCTASQVLAMACRCCKSSRVNANGRRARHGREDKEMDEYLGGGLG